jgi:hypothetical protein
VFSRVSSSCLKRPSRNEFMETLQRYANIRNSCYALLLKVLDDIIHRRKAIDATNPILCSFNAKNVADGGMGLNETQDHSVLGKLPKGIQRSFNMNRKKTMANELKNAAISPPTIQKPFGLSPNGMPPTFMPQILAISVAGRNTAENIVSM